MDLKFEKWQKAPEGNVDIILDTDTFNEMDDQFAIAYLLHYTDRINIKGFTVAPFENEKLVKTIAEGQEKSKNEIQKILRLADRTEYEDKIYTGAVNFMADESCLVDSEAARFIVKESKKYNSEHRFIRCGDRRHNEYRLGDIARPFDYGKNRGGLAGRSFAWMVDQLRV